MKALHSRVLSVLVTAIALVPHDGAVVDLKNVSDAFIHGCRNTDVPSGAGREESGHSVARQ